MRRQYTADKRAQLVELVTSTQHPASPSPRAPLRRWRAQLADVNYILPSYCLTSRCYHVASPGPSLEFLRRAALLLLSLETKEQLSCGSIWLVLQPREDARPHVDERILSRSPVSSRLRFRTVRRSHLPVMPGVASFSGTGRAHRPDTAQRDESLRRRGRRVGAAQSESRRGAAAGRWSARLRASAPSSRLAPRPIAAARMSLGRVVTLADSRALTLLLFQLERRLEEAHEQPRRDGHARRACVTEISSIRASRGRTR
jgi:hypothetical protein